MISKLYSLYALLFSRKIFYKIHVFIIKLGLRGIGVNNYYNHRVSGEEHFINNLKSNYNLDVVFDVGANVGNYTENFTQYNTYSFEPNPSVYEELALRFKDTQNIKVFNIGFSDKAEDLTLYVNKNVHEHSSLYKDVFDKIDPNLIEEIKIKLDTIDDFLQKNKIDKISFLKIDTEGNEYKVLKGATKSIAGNKIDIIQFEFGFPNIDSKVFLKDIMSLLSNYNFFRLLPYESLPLEDTYEIMHNEIFMFQNIIAVRKDIQFKM